MSRPYAMTDELQRAAARDAETSSEDRIWLQPPCPDECERGWADHDFGPCEDCGLPCVAYVRAGEVERQITDVRSERNELAAQIEEWGAEKEAACMRAEFAEDQLEVALKDRDHDERLLAEAHGWIAEATKVITNLSGGGSENFVQHDGKYRADLEFCANRIRERFDTSHRRLLESVKAQKEAEQQLADAQTEVKNLKSLNEEYRLTWNPAEDQLALMTKDRNNLALQVEEEVAEKDDAILRAEFAEDQLEVALKDRDHAERLLAEAREALKPFASVNFGTEFDSCIEDDDTMLDATEHTSGFVDDLTVGDFRRARAILKDRT